LQGLLLLSGDAQPNWLHEKDTALKEWRQFLFQSGYSPVEKCLEFVLGVKNISGILVGVDSAEHLNQIIDLTSNYRPLKSFDPSELNDLLIDPRRWPH
jgi:predicted aldo/keto reductase-like oxidoreductase